MRYKVQITSDRAMTGRTFNAFFDDQESAVACYESANQKLRQYQESRPNSPEDSKLLVTHHYGEWTLDMREVSAVAWFATQDADDKQFELNRKRQQELVEVNAAAIAQAFQALMKNPPASTPEATS